MNTGVYAKKDFEIAITKSFSLVHYKHDEVFGCKLYQSNKMIAIVERKTIDKDRAKYAFLNNQGQIITNDLSLSLRDKINSTIDSYDFKMFFEKDNIIVLNETIEMPTVSEVGIAKCLKYWTLGIEYNLSESHMYFHMQTKSLEYILSIDTQSNLDNIYCGISINIPFDNGLFGSGQYFRIRNYGDNSQPWCWYVCNLGNSIDRKDFNQLVCESGKCIQTNEGTYWLVKRYTDDEIVLQGCGDDEYFYRRNNRLIERFKID